MALLAKVPGMRVLAPSSAQDLQQMLHDAFTLVNDGPVVIRYPKGIVRNVGATDIGSGLLARELRTSPDKKVCILAIGKMVGNALQAAELLHNDGIETSVWDVRSCKPLDPAMIREAAQYELVLTFEDGIRDGGIGSSIVDAINSECAVDSHSPRVHTFGIPTEFIAQAKPDAILKQLHLDAAGMTNSVKKLVTNCAKQ
jgi:1-deoxy-D-xylulose-5-phosphate synthase